MAWAEGGWCHYGWCSDVPANTATLTFSLTAPKPVVSFTLQRGTLLSFSLSAPKPTVNFNVNVGATGSFSLVGYAPLLEFNIAVGSKMTFALVAPKPVISFDGKVGAVLTFDLVSPKPLFRFSGIVSPSAVSTKAIVMNLALEAVTEYPNYGFDSFFTLDGQVYGLNDDGIFPLSGADDNGTDIAISILSPDFDSYKGNTMQPAVKKLPREIYFLYNSDGKVDVVFDGEDEIQPYPYPIEHDRAKLGKGLDSRIFNIEVVNRDGASLEKFAHARIKVDTIGHRKR